jgi:hypothetical protein
MAWGEMPGDPGPVSTESEEIFSSFACAADSVEPPKIKAYENAITNTIRKYFLIFLLLFLFCFYIC